MMKMVEYAGWPHCIRLSNDEMELTATTDVGPRIIHFGFTGGQNFLKNFDAQCGKSGGEEWRSYGGHRLWHAPESVPRTYYPDNGPIEHEWDGETLTLKQPVEKSTGIEKQIEVRLESDKNVVHLKNRLINRNLWDVEAAPWALTVMDVGGRAIVPHEEFRPHSECLVPARPLVLWYYTDMSDPRWTWGRKYIQLQQDISSKTPQKIGVLNTNGWAAYALNDELFIKKYPYKPDAVYTDYGCNTELFTNPEIIEVETLGPLVKLAPGDAAEHEETWLLSATAVGSGEDEIDSKVLPLLKSF